jgi:hypothetical protein
MRVRWAFEEVGQPYDVRLLSFRAMKEPAHLALHPFGPSADLAGQSNSLAHEDKTPLLRVAQWVACAPCGLERMG